MIEIWLIGTWVLIWEYSARAIQYIPTWQGLDNFIRPLHLCALDESKVLALEGLTLMLGVAGYNLANTNDAKNFTVTHAHGCSSESTQRELSNEYQHDRV